MLSAVQNQCGSIIYITGKTLNALEHLTNLAKIDKRKPLLLIELFNSAVRRGIEGKFNEAVARFYRLSELFAQQLLGDETS